MNTNCERAIRERACSKVTENEREREEFRESRSVIGKLGERKRKDVGGGRGDHYIEKRRLERD